jgi:hypothetical protein
MIGVGAILATLLLAGWPPVADAWARLRPGHAWLNLVGFVSLIIAATLVHFFPTVVGARIGTHVSGRVSLLGLGAGPALVAAGYAFGLAVGVQLGAALAILGALALVRYATRIWPTRGRWTTDPDWHRFAIWGLVSAIGWFVCGIVVLGSRTFASGADPSGWSIEPVIGPLLGGWVGLAVVASATHLLPAVGPGDQAAHARQRAILGSLAVPRLVAWNLAVAGISIGLPLGRPGLVMPSAIGLAGAFGVTLVLLVRAVWIGLAAHVER